MKKMWDAEDSVPYRASHVLFIVSPVRAVFSGFLMTVSSFIDHNFGSATVWDAF